MTLLGSEIIVKEDITPGTAIGLIAAVFVRPAFLMLVLGGLASQLHLPRLAVGYWTAFLFVWAAMLLQRRNIDRWKVGGSDSKS